MNTVLLISSRTTEKFLHRDYEITGVPMNNHNTCVLYEELNKPNSIYKNGAFSARPNGSSYVIRFMGDVSASEFEDGEAMKDFVETALNKSMAKLKARNY
jgi:hypothetical protein